MRVEAIKHNFLLSVILLIATVYVDSCQNRNIPETLPPVQKSEISIDNGVLMVKQDLTRGGAISYISLSGSTRNLVNIHDEGRYIQQSYYAGKNLDRKAEGQSPSWSPWKWNPIQVGDSYRNRAKIIEYKQVGNTSYVKCTPMLWDMKNELAEAEMEQWNTLDGNVLKVHCKLTCRRTDNIYGESIVSNQELPAVYPISALDRLFSYIGNKPFTNDTMSNLQVIKLSSGFWGRYPSITEKWMAFVDDKSWGMGVYTPIATSFLAGMSGNQGGEFNNASTSYIAPIKNESFGKNSVFEFDYYIIIGSVDQIRAKVYLLK